MDTLKEKINGDLRLFYNNTVVNWHEHVWENPIGECFRSDLDRLVRGARKYGMDILVCSTPETGDPHCPLETMRRKNDILFGEMQRYPELIRGLCFVNPGADGCLDEIERCIRRLGMVGIKMYHQYFIDDEVQYPVMEKCIELDIPVLVHAGKLTFQPESQPRISSGEHFAAIAHRYPELNIIMAHLTGGGDWDWQLKPIVPYKNIMIDISGSVIDSHCIEKAVSLLGAERILFGTDGSVCSGVGKLLAAKISDEDKKTILSGKRYMRFLTRGRGK